MLKQFVLATVLLFNGNTGKIQDPKLPLNAVMTSPHITLYDRNHVKVNEFDANRIAIDLATGEFAFENKKDRKIYKIEGDVVVIID